MDVVVDDEFMSWIGVPHSFCFVLIWFYNDAVYFCITRRWLSTRDTSMLIGWITENKIDVFTITRKRVVLFLIPTTYIRIYSIFYIGIYTNICIAVFYILFWFFSTRLPYLTLAIGRIQRLGAGSGNRPSEQGSCCRCCGAFGSFWKLKA